MARYLLIAVCLSGLLLGSIRGIPKRDITRHLDSSAVQAEQAWHEGIKVHDRVLGMSAASAGESEKKRRRKAARQFAVALSRYDDALGHLANSDADPDWLYRLHTRRGDVLAALQRNEEALAAYMEATRLRPEYLQAIYGRARTELALGRLAELQESFGTLLEATEIYGEAWAYVDWMVASMRAWVSKQRISSDPFDGNLAEFNAWVEQQAEYTGSAVRWTLLPE